MMSMWDVCLDTTSDMEVSTLSQSASSLLTYAPDGTIKRPPNAFMLWASTERKRLYAAMPPNKRLRNSEVSKILGQKWKQMPSAEKIPFHRQASIACQQYRTLPYSCKKSKRERGQKGWDGGKTSCTTTATGSAAIHELLKPNTPLPVACDNHHTPSPTTPVFWPHSASLADSPDLPRRLSASSWSETIDNPAPSTETRSQYSETNSLSWQFPSSSPTGSDTEDIGSLFSQLVGELGESSLPPFQQQPQQPSSGLADSGSWTDQTSPFPVFPGTPPSFIATPPSPATPVRIPTPGTKVCKMQRPSWIADSALTSSAEIAIAQQSNSTRSPPAAVERGWSVDDLCSSSSSSSSSSSTMLRQLDFSQDSTRPLSWTLQTETVSPSSHSGSAFQNLNFLQAAETAHSTVFSAPEVANTPAGSFDRLWLLDTVQKSRSWRSAQGTGFMAQSTQLTGLPISQSTPHHGLQ